MLGLDVKVHIDRRWDTATVQVWLHRNVQGQAQVLTFDWDAETSRYLWTWIDYDPTSSSNFMRATLEMPEAAFQALIAAGADVLPPDRAQAAHLTDAQKVRDQALGMVERIIDSDLAREAGRK